MKRQISIRPEAEIEIEEAYHWYEEQRDGLGSDFLLCVEEGLEKIRKTPDMNPIVHRRGAARPLPILIGHWRFKCC